MLRRGLVHFSAGLAIAVFAWFTQRQVTVAVLGVVTFVWLTADLVRLWQPRLGAAFRSLFRPFLRDYEETRLTGASYLLVASLAVLVLFRLEVAVLAISFLAAGDPIARAVGERLGQRRLAGKNVKGFVACLAGCALAGLVWSYAGIAVNPAVVLAGMIAAAVAQALPLPLDDNLGMPLVSAAAMWLTGLVV